MSLNIFKRNTQSPFRLQRSEVPQSEGGSYQNSLVKPIEGDGGMADAISGLGTNLSEGIKGIDTDKLAEKRQGKKAERLARRKTKLEDKSKSEFASEGKKARLEKRVKSVESRKTDAETKYKKYKDINEAKANPEKAATNKLLGEPKKDEKSTTTVVTPTTEEKKVDLVNSGTITKSDEQKKKDREEEIAKKKGKE